MYGSTESPPAPPRLKKLTKALTLPLATAHDPPTSSQSHKKLLLIVFVGLILYNNTSPPINLPELAGSFPAAPNAWSTLPPSTASTKSSRLTPLQSVKRPASSSPSESLFLPDALSTPLPTNRWYQSLMLGMNDDAPLTKNQKAYTIPYVVDAMFTHIGSGLLGNPPGAGLRTHFPTVDPAGDKIVQLNYDEVGSPSLGAVTPNFYSSLLSPDAFTIESTYHIASPPNLLSLELTWFAKPASTLTSLLSSAKPVMRSPLVRGAPYITMIYEAGVIPTLSAPTFPTTNRVPPNTDLYLMIDDTTDDPKRLNCTGPMNPTEHSVLVTKTATLTFATSDATWVLYPSAPTSFSCRSINQPTAPAPSPGTEAPPPAAVFELYTTSALTKPTTLRLALANHCTTGTNPKSCTNAQPNPLEHTKNHRRLLDLHSNLYPTNAAAVEYTFPTMKKYDETSGDALVHFRWNPVKMTDSEVTSEEDSSSSELLMYALPHHVKALESLPGSSNGNTGVCQQPTMHGVACLILGSDWAVREQLNAPPSFSASTLPSLFSLPSLAESLKEDIRFRVPANYMLGAGDTYFSGKILAKLARILTITRDLRGWAAMAADGSVLDDDTRAVAESCEALLPVLPSDEEIGEALEHLKEGVEVWLNGTSRAPFIYDEAWGGMVSCGCDFKSETDSKGENNTCTNSIGPSCPGLNDPGTNFGHGFYNDHHFHNGYHIYAAAAASSFDAAFGRRYFEPVLSLIRDIANPSTSDRYFPQFRHKDWFLGSSWASGLGLINGGPYPNGRNQESSSEAIAAYEAVALFGSTMYNGFSSAASTEADNTNAATAASVRDMGRLLMATELRSADTYWHVRSHNTQKHQRIYPTEYTPLVVGMLWSTMAQFQTWFGSDAFLAYGIQLMPLTVASETRDEIEWAREMYPSFNASCSTSPTCEEQGWSILQYAVLATIGDKRAALEGTLAVPPSAFTSAGGNGHSLSNSIWYIATRPDHHYVPFNATDAREPSNSLPSSGACQPCSHDECTDDKLNKCPSHIPFVCSKGDAYAGCSSSPWTVSSHSSISSCQECCELHAGC